MPQHLVDPTQNRRVYAHSKCGLPIKGHKRGPDNKLICNVPVRHVSPYCEEVQSEISPLIRSPSQESFLASPPPSPERTPPPPPYPYRGNSSPIGGLGGYEGERSRSGSEVASSVAESIQSRPYAPRSPSPDSTISRRSPPLVLPPVGPWNKNWRTRWASPPTLEEMNRASPLVPTVLVDSAGNTIRGGSIARRAASIGERIDETKQDDQSEQGTTIQESNNNRRRNPFIRILRSTENNPLVTAVPARAEDISRIQENATRLGLFTSLLRTTATGSGVPPPGTEKDGENDWIVVIGQTLEMTQQFVEVAQRTMPGTIASDRDLMEGPRMITTPQLIFVSIFSTLLASTIFLLFV